MINDDIDKTTALHFKLIKWSLHDNNKIVREMSLVCVTSEHSIAELSCCDEARKACADSNQVSYKF